MISFGTRKGSILAASTSPEGWYKLYRYYTLYRLHFKGRNGDRLCIQYSMLQNRYLKGASRGGLDEEVDLLVTFLLNTGKNSSKKIVSAMY